MSAPGLAIFDVDGTLIDSQADILASMQAGFAEIGRSAPDRRAVLGIVGLSLPQAMAALAPDTDDGDRRRMVAAYKARFADLRAAGDAATAPLYPGMRRLLERLSRIDGLCLGIATGKSRRGLDALMALHDLSGFFVTTQTADDHPSKPHPAMIHEALRETGVEAARAVMIGDTRYDIDMAQAAGTQAIAVRWGYHDGDALRDAACIVADADDLETAIRQRLEAGS